MSSPMKEELLQDAFSKLFEHVAALYPEKARNALPDRESVDEASQLVAKSLKNDGRSIGEVTRHLLALTKGLSNQSLSSTYFGFVTGGSTPYATVADILATVHDQNAHAYLPEQSIAAQVEDHALSMLLELVRFDPAEWKGRILTTGATAGNIQGLACGREWVVQNRLPNGPSVGELGILEACSVAGIREIKVLSSGPHSSLGKAASIVGLGRNACIDVRRPGSPQELRIDFGRLERELSVQGRASIVAVSCGEVNTGNYATYSDAEMTRVRELCDKYKAWLHVDGAFGIFSRLLQDSGKEFELVSRGGAGMEKADSLASDLHKFLNVPYDCGFFVCRHPSVQTQVYRNANAAYLKAGSGGVPTALNIGAENSRRFRGFSVYGTLVGLGRDGYTEMLKRQVVFTRKVAQLIDEMPAYTLLNGHWSRSKEDKSGTSYEELFIIVLFGAKDDKLNARLTESINAHKRIYVSGTSWEGRPACRIAVSNWQVDIEVDLNTVRTVLEAVAQEAR